MLEGMVVRKSVCLRDIGGSRGGEVRCGRLLANRRVTVDRIVEGWSDQTRSAVAGLHVLAIQDTSEMALASLGDEASGLGLVKKGNVRGVLVHPLLAVDADTGHCLGLVTGKVWTRDKPVSTPHRARNLCDRESARWLETAQQAKPILAAAAMVTVVADRESDIYAEWARVPDARFHLLTRASVDRRLEDGGSLFGAARSFPIAGSQTLSLPMRSPTKPARRATVQLRYGTIRVRRPKNERDHSLPKSVSLTLVEVCEETPPAGVEPVHWRLLTTHSVATPDDAWRMVRFYQRRWTIEQLFRMLKSDGLRIEDSQVETADRLLKLAAIAVKAATIIIQLVQARDGLLPQPASTVFTNTEIDALEALCPTLEGKTAPQQNPHPPRTLAWASWIIARIGGWNGYYKPPGPKTMQRGFQRFAAINEGWHLRIGASPRVL